MKKLKIRKLNMPYGIYINLKSRKDRDALMRERWRTVFSSGLLLRIDGIVDSPATKGIYNSHKSTLEKAWYCVYNTSPTTYNENFIIMEDDIIPCNDFMDRYSILQQELPEDWDIFMLGHFTSEQSKFSKVTDHIYKAESGVLAMHCYMVRQSSYRKILDEFENTAYEQNLDVMWQTLQKKYNVYMAIPAFCYQYANYSDNSKCMDEIISEGTKKYFKETL